MHRPVLLVLALLACALGAAACGGGDDVDVQQVLRQTFGEDKDIRSGRVDLSLRLDANGLAQLQGPVTARLAGPFASTGPDQLPRFDFEANLDAGGQTVRAGAVSTGEKGFLSFQGQAYELSDELFRQFKAGYAEEARKSEGEGDGAGGVSFRTLGIDPQRWLTGAEYVGKEDVGGAETLRVRAGIDVPRLLEDVNRILGRAEQIQGQRARELTEAERRQISEAITEARLELWTGEDDRIMRRLNVRLRFEVPEENREAANGLTSGTIRFDLALGAINEEQEIAGPEGARPLEELIGVWAGGGGDAGGGGAGGGDQAATPYEQCVQDAGTDISKLQECAGLAGG
jgi:hypothetical protein